MLDDRRKEALKRLDISKIRPNGVVWIFGEQVRTYQLTKEEIRFLRWYHRDSSIAYQVNLDLEPRNYKIADDRNRYNHNSRTKKRVKNNGIGKLVIVGSLVVSIVVGAPLISSISKANDDYSKTTQEVTQPIYLTAPEETEYDLRPTDEGVVDPVDDRVASREETIKHLCDIYQVDDIAIYNKLVEITDNFTSSDYFNGHIAGVTCKGVEVYADNEEQLLTYAVRAMKQVPDRFGLNSSIYISNGYSSGDDYYKQISDVCEILGLDRDLMYAIVRSETGFSSELFNTINNPAGLRGVNGVDTWWKFENKEEGFLEFGMEMLKYYRKIGRDPHDVSPETIKLIGDIHAPLSDGNDNWLPNVLSCLEYAQNNEEELFGISEEIHGLGK